MKNPPIKLDGNHLYSTVRKAKEALKERQLAILDAYQILAVQAAASGDYETAEKILWKLLEHGPTDEDGIRSVEISVDKPKEGSTKPSGPAIQIGVQIGGIRKVAELPVAPLFDEDIITVESVAVEPNDPTDN